MTVLARRQIVCAAALAPLAAALRAGQYPSRPLRLIVPFPAGGATDIVARPVAQLLGAALGLQVFVDNRGGAGGSIGADAVAKAPPDGYTLLMGTVGTSAINAALYKRLPHDPVRDFTPIASIASAPVAIAVHAQAGFASLAELIARAGAGPDAIQFASAGGGTPGHIAGAMFCAAAGIRMLHIPYKGGGPAVADLLGGQIGVLFEPLQSVLAHAQGGRLRVLALTGAQRSPLLPEVPAACEAAGLADFEATAWWAVFGPAGLPPEVSKLLEARLGQIVRSPDYRRLLGSAGIQPLSVALRDFQQAEIAKWGAAVRSAGISLDQ